MQNHCTHHLIFDLFSIPRLAFFQHDMLKPTHLVGNLPGIKGLARVMRKADREKFKKRFDAWLVLKHVAFD